MRRPADRARTGAQVEPFVFKQDVTSSDFRAHCFITIITSVHILVKCPGNCKPITFPYIFSQLSPLKRWLLPPREPHVKVQTSAAPEGPGWPSRAPTHRSREGRNRTQGPPPTPTSMKPNIHKVTGHLLIINHFCEESLFLLLLYSSKYLRLLMHFLKCWICTSLKKKS